MLASLPHYCEALIVEYATPCWWESYPVGESADNEGYRFIYSIKYLDKFIDEMEKKMGVRTAYTTEDNGELFKSTPSWTAGAIFRRLYMETELALSFIHVAVDRLLDMEIDRIKDTWSSLQSFGSTDQPMGLMWSVNAYSSDDTTS